MFMIFIGNVYYDLKLFEYNFQMGAKEREEARKEVSHIENKINDVVN